MSNAVLMQTIAYAAIRLLQATAVCVSSLCVALVMAALAFLAIMVIVSNVKEGLDGSVRLVDQDFVLVFYNTPAVGAVAMVCYEVALLRSDARNAISWVMQWLLALIVVLGMAAMTYLFVVRASDPYTWLNVVYLLGAFIPCCVIVVVQWAILRMILWAAGKRPKVRVPKETC